MMDFTKQLKQRKGCQFKMKLLHWLPLVIRISFCRLEMLYLQDVIGHRNYLDAFNTAFLQFPKLCGMTGTAATESTEFESIYKLKVTIVPTNRPMIRKVFISLVIHRQHYNELIIALQCETWISIPQLERMVNKCIKLLCLYAVRISC